MQKNSVTCERRRWPHQRPLSHVPVEGDLLVANALVATNTPPTDQTTTWRPERPDLDGQLCLWVREPSLLQNLKTTPGGDRHRGLMDPRIRQLWAMICMLADPESFETVLNAVHLAEGLGVHPNTVRRWIHFLADHNLLTIVNAGGGRGLQVEVTWLKRGKGLAERRNRALEYQRAKAEKRRGSQERQTAFVSKESSTRECPCPDDSLTKGRLMKRVRNHTTKAMRNQVGARAICDLIGRALFHNGVPPEDLEAVVMALEFRREICVPRWAKTPAAVYRWARATLRALWEQMTGWWRRMDKAWDRAVSSRSQANLIYDYTVSSREVAKSNCKPSYTRKV